LRAAGIFERPNKKQSTVKKAEEERDAMLKTVWGENRE